MSDANTRRAVSRTAKKSSRVPVLYVDDIGRVRDDGTFVDITLHAMNKPQMVVVFTTENFYAALGKVIGTALPGMSGNKLS